MRQLLGYTGFDSSSGSAGMAWAGGFVGFGLLFVLVLVGQHLHPASPSRVLVGYATGMVGVLAIGLAAAGVTHGSYPDEANNSAGWAVFWRLATVCVGSAGAAALPLASHLVWPFPPISLSARPFSAPLRAWLPLAAAGLVAVVHGVAQMVDPMAGVAGAVLLVGAAALAAAAVWSLVAPLCCPRLAPGFHCWLRVSPLLAVALWMMAGTIFRAVLQADCDGEVADDCPLSASFNHNALAYLFLLLAELSLVPLAVVLYLQRAPIVWVSGADAGVPFKPKRARRSRASSSSDLSSNESSSDETSYLASNDSALW
ncbi:uncharacterized protein AMSG_03381 [Thecamonas trahens ATCC 50062]|uniref:Uncharacterized protein n=1 Tax=Thecamonas trahens ATCC 50062 TaxID=461836 RepID=A0A0L0D6L5_THETB|nr:hypothetical protein AMSG_03381 [Thecamonas trahens ATCC 50062]KNC46948.1 hypothetical protein AMSG_03381 [Thecamonas trahens ATCC 50062]|eukprot:XP_013760219.1 hypothetical protein AMSG_03381 [Thecamonas trahens ATCC 50062]